MKTVIDLTALSAAFTRTCGSPAPFARLLGRELVSYPLSRLAAAGHNTAVFCCPDHLSEISNYIEDRPGYFLSCAEPGSIPADDDLLILAGDCFFSRSITDLAAQNAPAVLVCCEPVGSDAVSLVTENNAVTALDDRSGGLCFAGAVYLPKEHAHFYKGGCLSLLRGLFAAGVSLTPVVTGFSARLTDASAFLELQRYLLDNAGGLHLPECRERVWSYSSIPAGAEIIPPAYIGRNVTLADGCRIGPYTVIDDDSALGRRASAENSFFGRRSEAGAHSRLSGSCVYDCAFIGRAVRMGEGSALGRGASVFDGATVCAGVSISPGRKVFEGAYVCDDLTRGSISSRCIDDDGCCSLGSSSSPADFIRFGAAAATAFPRGSLVAAAHSGTPAAEEMCSCLRMGLTSAGCKVLELGAGTRQLLAYTLSRCGLPLGCFVTSGSEDSVTLMSPGGLPLPAGTERRVERAFSGAGTRPVPLSDRSSSGSIPGFSLLYEHWLRSMLPKHPRTGVSVRCPDRQIQRLADRIFAEHSAVSGTGERLIFHIPQDGSACSVYSDASGYVLHDRLLLLALRNSFRSGAPAAVPFTCTSAADTLAAEENGRLLRYLISTDGKDDREARECASRIDNLFVRDGLALAALVTSLTEKSGGTFAELAEGLPKFYSTQRYIGLTSRTGGLAEALAAKAVGTGAELTGENSRAVIRRVKGSKGLMIFAEARTAEAAMSLCDEVTARVRALSRDQ